jgi:hypothetical protein
MRLNAILPAALLLSAIQLVAAEYGSLTRVNISGKIYTPAPAPRVAPAADGSTTYIERQTVSEITEGNVLQALVSRSIIPSAKGYSLGLLTDANLDGLGEFVAYRTAGPASAARRVPTDLLALNYEVGPRDGTIRNTSNDTLISIDLVSRDYAKLTVLDFEGIGILTRRHTNLPKQKAPLNQVVISSATGTFPGVNAPDSGNAGLGTLSLSLSDAKIVDLTPYGTVAPSTSSNGSVISTTRSATLDLGGSGPTFGGNRTNYTDGNTTLGGNLTTGSGSLTLGGSGTIGSGGTIVSDGILTPGGSTLGGNNTYTSGVTLNSGNLTVAGGSTLGGNGIISLNGGGSLAGGYLTIDTTKGATLPGLVVDASGNITQLPTFTTGTGPSRLSIITSTGTHVYTRDSSNTWTLVTS